MSQSLREERCLRGFEMLGLQACQRFHVGLFVDGRTILIGEQLTDRVRIATELGSVGVKGEMLFRAGVQQQELPAN